MGYVKMLSIASNTWKWGGASLPPIPIKVWHQPAEKGDGNVSSTGKDYRGHFSDES